jgi:hypothetical protein
MKYLLFSALILFIAGLSAVAQELPADSHTLLLLHFNDNCSGAQGEAPSENSGITFENGIFGHGAFFSSGNKLTYPSTNNISSTSGTLEFWMKSRWNGGDGQSYVALRFGLAGGMLICKDGANNWRSIFNRYAAGGQPENGVVLNVSNLFAADQWHHCAFTWTQSNLRLYIDGTLRETQQVSITLPAINDPYVQIGGDDTFNGLDAVVDELRISDIERSPEEIQLSCMAGLELISTLTIRPSPISLLMVGDIRLSLEATTSIGIFPILSQAAQWSSADTSIARVDSSGIVTSGGSSGQTTITVTYKTVSAQAPVTVVPVAFPNHDLEVAYIERTPKYPKYNVTYETRTFADDWQPYSIDIATGLTGQSHSTQRWPHSGDTVTFIAHVLNHGTTVNGSFSFAWYLDDEQVVDGVCSKSLVPYDTALLAWSWIWDSTRHRVKFAISGSDDRQSNNMLEDYTDALAFATYIERGHDVKFADQYAFYPHAIAISETEWFQCHAKRMNAMFEAAGSRERVRYDKLELVPDGSAIFPGGQNDRLQYDGIFPEVLRSSEETYRTISAYYNWYDDIDYALLHELGHQLGLIDLYRINVEPEQNPVNSTQYRTAHCLMMDVSQYISSHTSRALERWHGFRRGYFGQYLYDLPRNNRIRFVTASGKPVSSANVTVFQKILSPGIGENIPIQPKFAGTTDNFGIYELPNVNINTSFFAQTETGNFPTPNPFGYISNHGANGVFLLKVEKSEIIEYAWLDITEFNLAYWRGDTALGTYEIVLGMPDQYTVQQRMAAKWNMVSVPLSMDNYLKAVLYPTAISEAFAYAGTYTPQAMLAQGVGYWVKFDSAQTVPLTGNPCLVDTIIVASGWNLVGSISSSVAITDIISNTPSLVLSQFWAYDGRYTMTDTIEPGKGYWVKANLDGEIVLAGAAQKNLGNRVQVVIESNQPPHPPYEKQLVPEIPGDFRLEQNYPNPFNPSTILDYALPLDSYVCLAVFNTAGQRIKTLSNGVQSAGYKDVIWDASNMPAGVYFYRLDVTSVGDPTKHFSQTRKMLLIK